MANTAPVPHAPVSREIAPGVTVSNTMTPTQILEAHVKAGVQSQFHTNDNVARMNYGDAAQKGAVVPAAKPATPATTPEPTPAEKVAAFDSDMRATGKQLTVAPLEAEERMSRDIDLLTEQYKSLMQPGSKMPESQRLNFKRTLERDIANVLEGKLILSDAQVAKMSNPNGRADTLAARVKEPPAKPTEAPASTYTPEQWADGHKSVTGADGQIDLARLNPAGLSGYTLPKLIEGQTVNASVFEMLASARAAGFTQKQVDDFVRADLKAGGWLK